MIRVGVSGANGKMGREVVSAVEKDKELELTCAIDKYGAGELLSCGVKVIDVPKFDNVDIIVDFTQPSCIFENIKTYMKNKVKSVIGTTGLSEDEICKIEKMSKENNTGIIIAPNFSIGAILMMKYAKEASKYFSNAEIIEYHHNQKKDAPSGTSIKTAQMMIENNNNFKLGNCDEKETITGARGAESGSVQIHSVRMPGFVASQEVIFGSDGQTLKIRHDTINRSCYMSGVILAIKHLYNNNDFIYGLENIL